MHYLSEQTVCIPKRLQTVKLVRSCPLIPPLQERILAMHEFLFFIIGTLLGGIIGVVTMSLVQINRINHSQNVQREEDEIEKTKY